MLLTWTCKRADCTEELLGACSTCQLIVVMYQFEIRCLCEGDEAANEGLHGRGLKRWARYLAGTQPARVVLTKPDPHEAFLRVSSDSDCAGDAKDRKSPSSLKIEFDGRPLCSGSRKQKARAHSSGEA